jgi:hypothetical protein
MFDGNGNWTSDFSAQADRDNGIKILASRFDNIFIADIKESFENCLTKDGQITPIGNFNMGGQRILNLDDGVNAKDAVNKSQLDTTVKLTGDQTIADVKTFEESPIIPTPTAGDSSTKAATTEFVNTLVNTFAVGFPDYANRVGKSANKEYTADSDGVLFAFGQLTSGNKSVIINGVSFRYVTAYGDGGAGSGNMFPLKAGDTYKVEAAAANQQIYFIPFRG